MAARDARLAAALVALASALPGCVQGEPAPLAPAAPAAPLEGRALDVTVRPPPGEERPTWAMSWPVREFLVEGGLVTIRAWPDGVEGADFRLTLRFREDLAAPADLRHSRDAGALDAGEF